MWHRYRCYLSNNEWQQQNVNKCNLRVLLYDFDMEEAKRWDKVRLPFSIRISVRKKTVSKNSVAKERVNWLYVHLHA